MLNLKISKETNIHHKDGNPLNNSDDGNNWMVLCQECHIWFHATTRSHFGRKNGTGIKIQVSFTQKKKAELLAGAKYCCERCGKYLLEMKCPFCGETIDQLDQQIKTKEGLIAHKDCFDGWVIIMGKEPEKGEIMSTKVIRVDDYTYELAEKVVKSGKANNFTDAINKALAYYLGIPYKSREERRLEKELTYIQQLAKLISKEE